MAEEGDGDGENQILRVWRLCLGRRPLLLRYRHLGAFLSIMWAWFAGFFLFAPALSLALEILFSWVLFSFFSCGSLFLLLLQPFFLLLLFSPSFICFKYAAYTRPTKGAGKGGRLWDLARTSKGSVSKIKIKFHVKYFCCVYIFKRIRPNSSVTGS